MTGTVKVTCETCANGWTRTESATDKTVFVCTACAVNELRCESKLDGGSEAKEIPT